MLDGKDEDTGSTRCSISESRVTRHTLSRAQGHDSQLGHGDMTVQVVYVTDPSETSTKKNLNPQQRVSNA